MKTLLWLISFAFLLSAPVLGDEPWKLNGIVLQKLEHGALVQAGDTGGARGNNIGQGNYPSFSDPLELRGVFFVIDLPSFKTLVDGDPVQAPVRLIGQYSYTDAFGAKRTVRAYSAQLK